MKGKRTIRLAGAGICVILLTVFLVLPAAKKETLSEKKEPVIINVWTKNRHDLKFQQEKVDQYNASNKDNIFVKYKVYSNNYTQAVNNAIANGNAPDLMAYADDIFFSYVKQRNFENLLPYMDKEFLEMFRSVMVDGMNVEDGKCYYIPTGISCCRLIYNKDIFERVGIKAPPKTMEELIEAASAITGQLEQEGIYGFAVNLKETESALERSFMQEALAETGIHDGYDFAKGIYDFSKYEGVIELWRTLLSEKCAYPECRNLSIDPLREMFAQGKIGMYFTYAFSETGVYNDLFPTEVQWDCVPVPVQAGKKNAAGIYTLNNGYLMNARSTHKEEAWKAYRAIFADKENLAESYMEGLSVTAIPQVAEAAEKKGYSADEVCLPAKDEHIWPKSPHERNSFHIEGRDWADEIKRLLFNKKEIAPVLEGLSERYNIAYEKSLKYGLCEEVCFEDFDPEMPMLTGK